MCSPTTSKGGSTSPPTGVQPNKELGHTTEGDANAAPNVSLEPAASDLEANVPGALAV